MSERYPYFRYTAGTHRIVGSPPASPGMVVPIPRVLLDELCEV